MLDGNNEVKEYSLGVEVFGRGEAFDPRTDTIVRVQARRLRSKLKDYYDAEGQTDPIVIELPKGHYGVTFGSASWQEHGSTLHLKSLEAHRNQIDGVPIEAASARLPCLPALRTPLIGREQELAALKRLLIDVSPRLITLTGAGGSGKTRLGLQAASEVIAEFPGGVYFVALASITDPTTVTSTVAQVLGIRHTGGKPLAEALQDQLRLLVHDPALLLLDMFVGGLSGAPCSTPGHPNLSANAVFFLVLDVAQFAGAEHFLKEVTGLAENIRACPRAEGVSDITLPGDPERKTKAQRLQTGIAVDDGTWNQLVTLANKLGMKAPSV
jgi:hypothetical protein